MTLGTYYQLDPANSIICNRAWGHVGGLDKRLSLTRESQSDSLIGVRQRSVSRVVAASHLRPGPKLNSKEDTAVLMITWLCIANGYVGMARVR